MDTATASLERFAQHGGRLAAARVQFPDAPLPWVDLSTGINRRSYPAPHASVTQRRELPQADQLARLEQIAAAAFGVDDPARVVAVAGTELAIRLLPLVLNIRSAAVVGPTYSSHADAWRFSGAVVRQVATVELTTLNNAQLALTIVNPNNPDGALMPCEQLLELHHLVAPQGALIIDEAFVDVNPAVSVSSLAGSERAPRMIVLRSFGKFFGLAGMRLGFVIAATPIASRLRHLIGDWPVSVDALVAGSAAYADLTWSDRTRDWLTRQSTRLDAVLARLGYDVIGGTSLFRLARLADAAQRFQSLARAGILVRPFEYDPTLLRFGLPYGRGEWQRLSASAGHS